MRGRFMHVGRFAIEPENQDAFVTVIKNYENNTEQKGLDHSHLIKAEKEANIFWYVTIWGSKADWEAVEELPAHKEMHNDRDPLLARPADQNFGTIIA